MDRFERLRVFLDSALLNPPSTPDAALLSRLQLKLERARPAFLDFLDTPGKDTKQREQLNKGTFTYVATGSSYPAGPALVKDILSLSDALGMSEELAASLVAYGINAKPRSGSGRAEAGLLVHLEERASLLMCLHAIWRGTLSADERVVNSGIQRVFEREVEELTRGRGTEVTLGAAVKAKGSWVEKVIKALDDCKGEADKLRSSLSTPVPSIGAIMPAGQAPSFPDDVTQMRIQRYDEERQLVGQLLFLIGAGSGMSKDDIRLLIRQLSTTAAADTAAVYILVALLAALDVSTEVAARQASELFADANFISHVKGDLNANWTTPALRAVVQLQWSIFLDVAAREVPGFEKDGGEEVDTLTWQAIDAGVFAFLGRSVLACKGNHEISEMWSAVGVDLAPLGGDAEVDPTFRDYIVEQVETLVVEVITNRISILRKLRNREEDMLSASHRGGARRTSRGAVDSLPPTPRHDLEAFFLLVATIYRNNDDAGLRFWQSETLDPETNALVMDPTNARLAAFLRWGSECRPPAMMRAFYEMIASLASGAQSATYAYEFLSLGGALDGSGAPSSNCSWAALFGALEFYINNLPDRPLEVDANSEGLNEIPPDEVPLLRAFVHLLRQVVAYSDVARATLHDNQRHKPVTTLFALTTRSVPIDLKASLLSAIEAFARPGGAFAVDVARKTWLALEQSQILPTWSLASGKQHNGVRRPDDLAGGILTELEEVEAPNHVFPESTAFVRLLSSLVHVPTSSDPLRRSVELETHAIPDNIGAPNRPPGLEPYITFVVEDVLLKAGSREYADPRERWQVTDACLAFVEKCLAAFDLGPFLAWASNGGRLTTESASPLHLVTQHPGFDVLTRVLSGSALLETILTIVTAGYDSIRNNLAKTSLFTRCMVRCLRIIRRVLDVQTAFLEVVLPALLDSGMRLSADKLARLKALSPIDQSFLYHSEVVVQIALLVACEDDDEVALLAVGILRTVADSPYFDVQQRFPDQSRTKLNRLVGLLQASPETLRIQEAFIGRLEEDLPESELEAPEWTQPIGDAEVERMKMDNPAAFRRAIKAAVLDLFLAGTRPDRSAPNVSHLLLGFNLRARPDEMEIEDPEAADTTRTTLHVVLELLAQNVSRDEADVQTSILVRHPALASRCYRLVRQLCMQPFTSAVMSRYLRNREQYFLRQSLALPFAMPSASSSALGSVQYADGKEISTSCPAISAILESEAWLLEAATLELSVLATGNDTRRAGEIVAAYLESPSTIDDDVPDYLERDGGLEQGLPRILEIFHAFDFAWSDAIVPVAQPLSLFADLRFDSCLQRNVAGCETYDFTSLLSLLNAARRELQNRGLLNTPQQQQAVKQETRAIVETLVVENHRREIQFARYQALKAWRNLLDIILVKAFHLLSAEGRHSLLLDLLGAVLPPLTAPSVDASVSELLSGAAVLLATKLRDEGVSLLFVDAGETVESISPERLHAILRAILQAIFQPGVSLTVRGNLYATLLGYLQYSQRIASLSPALSRDLDERTNGTGPATIDDDVFSIGGSSMAGEGASPRRNRRSALEHGNFSILSASFERLLPIVCRDAAVGHEVWRTVAFTVLDAFVTLAQAGRVAGKMLAILAKQGYLGSFVTALKDAEAGLLAILQPDPSSLNALYVYEAQMSFLIRIAAVREGAEKLLGAELLPRLADCDFLGARPLADSDPMEFDGFIPPATERHHQLLLPALQLVANTVISFGSDTSVAVRQLFGFIAAQRENLLVALKDCAAQQTVPLLREAHLIVTLMNIVLPSISDDDLATLSSFGGLHSGVLALSARICSSQDWVSQVLPSNDVEREENQTLVLALRGSATVFGDKVETLAASLQSALLAYENLATRKRPGSDAFRPVLLPTLKFGENSASGQSFGSMGAFLRDVTRVLEARLHEVDSLAELLDSFDSRSLDEIEDIFDFPADDSSDADRRGKIAQELQTLATRSRAKLETSMNLLEAALLLYQRHVAFFLDSDRADKDGSGRPDVGLGLAVSLKARKDPNAMLSVSQYNLPPLREDLAEEVSRLTDKLNSLSFTQRNAGSSYAQREAFIGIVTRRLQELLLLDGESA